MISIKQPPSELELQEYVNFTKQHDDGNPNIDGNFATKPRVAITEYDKSELIGFVYIFPLIISFSEQSILSGGIGGLVVRKDHRRQGVASKILKEAMTFIQHKNLNLALLSTDITRLKALYFPFGFQPLNRPYSFRDKSEPNGMLAPVNSGTIFNKILESKEIIYVEISSW